MSETFWCVFCDNQVADRICLNCKEYKGVVAFAEYQQLQREWGVK